MYGYVKTFVAPLVRRPRWSRVCEIGAARGESTDLLLPVPGVQLTVIDPCLDCDLLQKYAHEPRITVRKGISLDVLPTLHDTFDCILIDGDHNWYTVYHELATIDERGLLRPGGLIFLHDVNWPWARRDLYYQPELIPSAYRHTYQRGGILRGQSTLSPDGLYASLSKAEHEGGTRNGVLTAIEDFLREHPGYRFFRINGGSGLAILQSAGGDAMAFRVIATLGLAANLTIWVLRLTRGKRLLQTARWVLIAAVAIG
jgi:predicted O-methyltransferase YrrM